MKRGAWQPGGGGCWAGVGRGMRPNVGRPWRRARQGITLQPLNPKPTTPRFAPKTKKFHLSANKPPKPNKPTPSITLLELPTTINTPQPLNPKSTNQKHQNTKNIYTKNTKTYLWSRPTMGRVRSEARRRPTKNRARSELQGEEQCYKQGKWE